MGSGQSWEGSGMCSCYCYYSGKGGCGEMVDCHLQWKPLVRVMAHGLLVNHVDLELILNGGDFLLDAVMDRSWCWLCGAYLLRRPFSIPVSEGV